MMDGSALDLATNIGMMNRGRNYDGDYGCGFGGGWGMWLLIILFFIMGVGGGGIGNCWGNNGWGVSSGVNALTNEFLFTNINNTLDRGFNQLANQNFGIQKDMCQGFSGLQMEIANNRFAAQQCCCETNRNIDAVRYENAKNTCDIITANTANTQRIIDQMNADKIDALRTELQSAQLALQNNAQTQTLINQLRPCPIPAYLTCSPYTAYPTGNLFCNGFSGCGNCGNC